MNHPPFNHTGRPSEGAASVVRLHEAWRANVTSYVPTSRGGSIAGDPLLLDTRPPSITPRRAVPHLHLVHRVNTETDLPVGMAGVAIGHAALAEHRAPVVTHPRPVARRSKVDPVLRSRVWRTLLALYLVAGAAIAWALLA